MKKLSAAIIDDEKLNIDLLKDILIEYNSDIIDIVFTSTNAKEAEQKINSYKPNILFLDIKLDTCTAFDLLKRIDPYDFLIVFVTAYNEYAIESFKFNTAYFILKPISNKEVNLGVNIAWREYHNQKFTTQKQIQNIIDNINNINIVDALPIPEVGAINFVRYNEINFCKSDGRYTEVHKINGEIEVSAKNIGRYESILPGNIFFRVHKSYIVNVNEISLLGNNKGMYCKLKNGVIIPVSKRKSAQLLKYITTK